MQIGTVKWFDAQEGFGAIQLNTITAIFSIFAIAAAVSAAIAIVANIQLANVG